MWAFLSCLLAMLSVFITAVELSIMNKNKPTCSLYFSPSAPNYSALSYKVKTSTLSDGFNFCLGPMPDKVSPLLKLNPTFSIPGLQSHPYPIFHTDVHTRTHTQNQPLLQCRTKSISPAILDRLIAFPSKPSRQVGFGF